MISTVKNEHHKCIQMQFNGVNKKVMDAKKKAN